MPTYEYECSQCGAEFEAFQMMTDAPLDTCRVCGTVGTVERLIGSGAGLIFKGSGFYETDYKRPGASGSGATKSDAAVRAKETLDKANEKSETSSASDSKSSKATSSKDTTPATPKKS